MMQEIIEVANPKFQEYRDSMKLADDWNRLTVDDKSMEGSFVLSTWKGISPFSHWSGLWGCIISTLV